MSNELLTLVSCSSVLVGLLFFSVFSLMRVTFGELSSDANKEKLNQRSLCHLEQAWTLSYGRVTHSNDSSPREIDDTLLPGDASSH